MYLLKIYQSKCNSLIKMLQFKCNNNIFKLFFFFRCRTTEVDNILDRFYKLHFKENVLKITDNNTQCKYF